MRRFPVLTSTVAAIPADTQVVGNCGALAVKYNNLKI